MFGSFEEELVDVNVVVVVVVVDVEVAARDSFMKDP